MRASYNLLRKKELEWRVGFSLLAPGIMLVCLLASFSFAAICMAIAAVVLSRHLFFVSVVPLSMGLTFLKGRVPHGVAA